MLFQVQMEVRIPHDVPVDRAERLKREERERAQELQKSGIWRHLWRHVGRYANTSIFDVGSAQELHDILSTLPLFPFMEISITALCRHPSSVHDGDQ
ncbi:muconolactone Delta-isomerase [Bradyrhizobium sp. STM 3809]|uniref:muconolactone Delta-isomerase n=1 Tax=Bradyrhizobium sp. STM 3809 TaxID=551936 RepID=UPI0002408299|nr:muconolactone Delta-isomerase [Bradyrhizobium sp. STM 3809]CCE03561.1 Muconolactone Delta-isomerase 2 (MIase 2) [Bradyrhizobium sp. STM 3809]